MNDRELRATVADGLIGIAQWLEAEAKRLKRDAKLVRAGSYQPDFAACAGRNVRYRIVDVIETELHEGLPL